MKKNIFYILIATILLLASCSSEEAIPIAAAFEIEIVDNDYSERYYILQNNVPLFFQAFM